MLIFSQNVKYFPVSIFKESETWILKLPKYSLQILKQKQDKKCSRNTFHARGFARISLLLESLFLDDPFSCFKGEYIFFCYLS